MVVVAAAVVSMGGFSYLEFMARGARNRDIHLDFVAHLHTLNYR